MTSRNRSQRSKTNTFAVYKQDEKSSRFFRQTFRLVSLSIQPTLTGEQQPPQMDVRRPVICNWTRVRHLARRLGLSFVFWGSNRFVIVPVFPSAKCPAIGVKILQFSVYIVAAASYGWQSSIVRNDSLPPCSSSSSSSIFFYYILLISFHFRHSARNRQYNLYYFLSLYTLGFCSWAVPTAT